MKPGVAFFLTLRFTGVHIWTDLEAEPVVPVVFVVNVAVLSWVTQVPGVPVTVCEGVMRALGDGFLKIGQDVTERRKAEEKLRESEERLRVALSAGEMGTWLWRIPQDERRGSCPGFPLSRG